MDNVKLTGKQDDLQRPVSYERQLEIRIDTLEKQVAFLYRLIHGEFPNKDLACEKNVSG